VGSTVCSVEGIALGLVAEKQAARRRPVGPGEPAATRRSGGEDLITAARDARSETDFGVRELFMDLWTLIEKGWTDDHIAEELECASDLVGWFRERKGDGL
jgi:hypothetical protein